MKSKKLQPGLNRKWDLFCFAPVSMLLCKKKIARAPGGHKKILFTKLGGGNRVDPENVLVPTIDVS